MNFPDAETKILFYALVWVALLVLALARSGNKLIPGTLGLPLAFMGGYTSGHAGAVIHLLDGYDHTQNPYLLAMHYTRDTVADGFEASCLAMTTATLGFAAVDVFFRGRRRNASFLSLNRLHRASIVFISLGLSSLVIGQVLSRFGESLPGLQAIMSSVQNLFVVGACGWVLNRYLVSGPRRALLWASALALVIPTLLLVSAAILADSIVLAIMIGSFYLSISSRAFAGVWQNTFIVMISAICALVFASFYMQARDALRDVVWTGGSVNEALGVLVTAADAFDIGATADANSLALLDARINQNVFVGLAIENLQSQPSSFENGATIALAFLAWVPRAFWPEKPERGGSEFVSKYTGLSFAEGATFAAGPVFELYVNFGYSGVGIGFFILGILVRFFDVRAFKALGAEDFPAWAQYQLAGMSFLQPLADIFFVVIAIATAFVIGIGLRRLSSHC